MNNDIRAALMGDKEAAKRLADVGALMTREEAIKCVEEIKASAWGYHIDKEMLGIPYSEFIEILDTVLTALTALRPVSREQVEKVWRGEWIHAMPILGSGDEECRCSKCGNLVAFETDFCPHCGAPMTDEAVEMVMERLEALNEV